MSRIISLLLALPLAFGLVACSSAEGDPVGTAGSEVVPNDAPEVAEARIDAVTAGSPAADEEAARPDGWTEETHSNDVEPNYDVVFPADKVNTITITIDPADWEAMQADMTEILGEPGTGGFGGGPDGRPGGGGVPGGEFASPEGMEPPAGEFTPPENAPEGMEPPAGGLGPGRGGFQGGGPGDLVSETPMWVPATIEFNGNVWNHVGIRYKGNSSLASAWNSGSLKMPFKFDFDEFEDDYPAIDNQRFYGFKQLSLANGFSDNTYLRETLTYDVMRESGLVASRTAFYEVILDYGEGPVNLGIYTVVEVIDDTVIESAFGDDSGNIYEGDGSGVTLAEGTIGQIPDSFEKENNEAAADWSDIEALYNTVHTEMRTSNAEQWRASLEALFDVDTFLNWLAVSAVVQNWDTYGAMTHNFYLYNNPETGQLVWLPWDHNMTFGVGGGGGNDFGGRGGMGGRANVTFDKSEVGEEWPLIRFLLDDPIYYERYLGYLADADTNFDAHNLNAHIDEMATMLRPYIVNAGEEAQFETGVDQLKSAVAERDTAVAEFLATQ